METTISFCQEQGILTAAAKSVLHTFSSNLKRPVHIHCIVCAGRLKLTAKAERFIRLAKQKKKRPKANIEKVSVVKDHPS